MTYDIVPSYPDDKTLFEPKVIRMSYFLVVSHPVNLRTLQCVTRVTYESALCHLDEITIVLIPMSSG